ncbi:hypothetical protein JRI60_42690 [Archangium violaceum]|uniref:hypothetical protein n=1 Tax=Archangium violaceum TaxID=83451 RepID=UPI0019523BA2|nr:hypothetical protein [Archangium violaceum]QRN95694.1 hypothetical protein JRI60_42690 [Archangium violaceum]
MNRFFAVGIIALSALAGCGGEDDPGSGNTGGGNTGTTQKCSAANCTGCCFNNVCQTGNTAAACGKTGVACVACGSLQVCKTDQTCGVDPSSEWLVQPVSARITSNNNGSSWDGEGSAPDVFVAMRCPGSDTVSSTSEMESYNPTWTTGGCTAKASQLLADPWVFQLWDSDVSSNDTITGTLGFRFTEQHLIAGTVTLGASGGMTSMTVQLKKQP